MKNIWIILLLMLVISLSPVEAATITLAKDTVMHPQGWAAGGVLFKEGTTVTLNEKGEAVSGTLKWYMSFE